jgi:hypothetical protein
MHWYVNPFFEPWLKLMAATSQMWLQAFPAALRSAPPPSPEATPRPWTREFVDTGSQEQQMSGALLDPGTLDALEARLPGFRTFVSEALASEAARRAELDFDAEDRRGEVQEARSLLAMVSREREDLSSRLYAAAMNAERSREERAALQAELDTLRLELRGVREERGILAARLAEIEAELVRARTALADAARERDAVSARLEAIVVEAHATHAELNGLIEGLRDELADALRDRAEAEAFAAEAGRALQDESRQVNALLDAARIAATRGATQREARDPRGPVPEETGYPPEAFAFASDDQPMHAGASTVTRLPTRRAELEIHFRKPADWNDAIHLHYWTGPGEGTQWPGVRMGDEGDGWFGLRLDGVSEAMLVFNDGHGRQTADYRRSREGWFADGEWRDEKPVAPGDVLHFPEFQSWFDKVAGT